jgi:hypothetical protein
MYNLISIGLFLAFGIAYASNLNPGGTLSPVPVYSYPSSEFASPNGNGNGAAGANPSLQGGAAWSIASNLAGADINFTDFVYADPTTGDLDFFYQIEPSITGNPVDSNSAELWAAVNGCALTGLAITGVQQITTASFSPFGNFVKPTAGTNSISSVSLSPNAQDLTIDFSQNVQPGQYSAILLIETNATACDQNTTNTFGGTVEAPGNSSGSESNQPPSSDVPAVVIEPGVYGILALGSSGLMLLVRRRSLRITKKFNSPSL